MTDRQVIDADIVCVGLGPATAGFLATLAPRLVNEDGQPVAESRAMPGLPPQVIAFERADGLGYGVSGVVTRARGIRESIPGADLAAVPMAAPVSSERLVYLLDPIGASRRSLAMRAIDGLVRCLRPVRSIHEHAVALPYLPPFLHKRDGLVLSIGAFIEWVSARVMGHGTVQVWPGSPVASPIIEGTRVVGVRLVDQGTDRHGEPAAGYMPGMDVRAALTVIGDGPVGAVGRAVDAAMGVPDGHASHEWAIGMKMVVDLREDAGLEPGTIIHTIGFPEPEIFGFLYVHPGGIASLGIFVPSWFESPVRTAYRYLQHWMLHPYLWSHLRGGRMRSWGAKSLQESGAAGEPFLAGDGWARIGEGSGSTNVLTNSGVDEAWSTGCQLAEAVLELLKSGEPFTRESLERTYVARRRASWVGVEARRAARARDGFDGGVVRGLLGLALSGMTGGRLALSSRRRSPHERVPSLESYCRGRVDEATLARLKQRCAADGVPLHDAVMDALGWPAIPLDGQLLVSHQDALLMGGKVQAPPGYADHVRFDAPELCRTCGTPVCIEACSGQAIAPGPGGVPVFEREKCVYCGACVWNCAHAPAPGAASTIAFEAGAGGLHSAEN
jgi:electron-transferring-flavoprotein dehydrogenase